MKNTEHKKQTLLDTANYILLKKITTAHPSSAAVMIFMIHQFMIKLIS